MYLILLFVKCCYRVPATYVHIGNFKTYLCKKCVIQLKHVLLNLKKHVLKIRGNMVPEDIDDFREYSNVSQLKAIHSMGHMKSVNMVPDDINGLRDYDFRDYSDSISKIKTKKYNRSRSYNDNLYQNARKSYKDCHLNTRKYKPQRSYELSNVSPWSPKNDPKEKLVSKCYLEENVFIPDQNFSFKGLGFRPHNFAQSQRYKHRMHTSNVKKSRRSASITSNDSSYVDNDSDISPTSLNDTFEFPSFFAYTRNSEVCCMNAPKDVGGDERSISMTSNSSEKGFTISTTFLKRNENILQDWKKCNDSNQQIIGGINMDLCNDTTLGDSNTENKSSPFKNSVDVGNPEHTGPKEPICKEMLKEKRPYLRIKKDEDLLRSDFVNTAIPFNRLKMPWTTPDESVVQNTTILTSSHSPELSHLPQTYSPVLESNGDALMMASITDNKEKLSSWPKVKKENIDIKFEFSKICGETRSMSYENSLPYTYSLASNNDLQVKDEIKEEYNELGTLKKECISPDIGSGEEMDASYYDNLQYSWSMGWDEELS